jgi:hypothetical protein
MALPGSLSEYIRGLLSVYDGVERLVLNVREDIEDQIGATAARIALAAMGIFLPEDENINQETITKAINQAIGGDIEFTNLFDKDAVRADVRRMAIKYAETAYGYDGGKGISGLKEKIIADAVAQVRSEIEAGAGEYIDAASDLVAAQEILDYVQREGWNEPKDFSAGGISNRERQAKYRANHKRVWVAR